MMPSLRTITPDPLGRGFELSPKLRTSIKPTAAAALRTRRRESGDRGGALSDCPREMGSADAPGLSKRLEDVEPALANEPAGAIKMTTASHLAKRDLKRPVNIKGRLQMVCYWRSVALLRQRIER